MCICTLFEQLYCRSMAQTCMLLKCLQTQRCCGIPTLVVLVLAAISALVALLLANYVYIGWGCHHSKALFDTEVLLLTSFFRQSRDYFRFAGTGRSASRLVKRLVGLLTKTITLLQNSSDSLLVLRSTGENNNSLSGPGNIWRAQRRQRSLRKSGVSLSRKKQWNRT